MLISSCASVQSSSGKNYERLYRDCVNDYNAVVEQDDRCAKELEKCVSATEINQDVIHDINRDRRKKNAMWFGIGFGAGTIIISGVALGLLLR